LEKGNSGEAAELKSGDAGCGDAAMRRCGDAGRRGGGRVKRLERLEKL
jgi:hypothetical protein